MNDLASYVDARALAGRQGFRALDWLGKELTASAPFVGGNVLEIGAGEGLLSLWALHRGARTVVSLEPEADGSTHGAAGRASVHRSALRLDDRWELRADTFQTFRPDRPFRLVLMHNAVNHLDEPACMRLHEDAACREKYRELFLKIGDLLEPGGAVVLADTARFNLWPVLGLRSPWAPEIEWHKHQEPDTWMALLAASGLVPVSSRWRHPFRRTERLLGPLLHNALSARMLASWFIVTAQRPR